MILYYSAPAKQAEQILEHGFEKSKRGRTCRYLLTDQPFSGGDVAVPCDALLRIDLDGLNDFLIAFFERTEPGSIGTDRDDLPGHF